MIELIRSLWMTKTLLNHRAPTDHSAQVHLKIIYLNVGSEWLIRSKSTKSGEMPLEYISKLAVVHHDLTITGLIFSTLLTKNKDPLATTNTPDVPKITIYIKAILACSSMGTKSLKLSNLGCLWTLEGRIAITIHSTVSANLLIQLKDLITKEAIHLDVASIEC